jgi:transcriptional regulator with XRE-family HTH domain
MERGKSLSVEEQQRVREALGELLRKHGTQQALAGKLGVTQQTVSQVLRGLPPGVVVARRVAEELSVPLENLLSGKRERVVHDPRYPNLALALEHARRSNWDSEGIALFEEEALKSDTDRLPEEWRGELLRFIDGLAFARRNPEAARKAAEAQTRQTEERIAQERTKPSAKDRIARLKAEKNSEESGAEGDQILRAANHPRSEKPKGK